VPTRGDAATAGKKEEEEGSGEDGDRKKKYKNSFANPKQTEP